MGVGDDLGPSRFRNERSQNLLVALRGFGYPDVRKAQPLLHLAPRLSHGDRALEYDVLMSIRDARLSQIRTYSAPNMYPPCPLGETDENLSRVSPYMATLYLFSCPP